MPNDTYRIPNTGLLETATFTTRTGFVYKALIGAFQGYLRDLQKQVTAFRKQGLSAEATAVKVDLTAYKGSFPQIQGPGADIRGVRRMYDWLGEKGKK